MTWIATYKPTVMTVGTNKQAINKHNKWWVAVTASALTATLALTAIPANAATKAAPEKASYYLRAINAVRASRGLKPVTVDAKLTSVAQTWANRMASANQLVHNNNYSNQVKPGWTRLGENIAYGPTNGWIMSALRQSPPHYANMVDPRFNKVGIGVAIRSDGTIYTTHDFASY